MTEDTDNAYDHVSPDTIAWMFFAESVIDRFIEMSPAFINFKNNNTRDQYILHVVNPIRSRNSAKEALEAMGLHMGHDPGMEEEERYSVCPGCTGQKPEAKRVCDDCAEDGL